MDEIAPEKTTKLRSRGHQGKVEKKKAKIGNKMIRESRELTFQERDKVGWHHCALIIVFY